MVKNICIFTPTPYPPMFLLLSGWNWWPVDFVLHRSAYIRVIQHESTVTSVTIICGIFRISLLCATHSISYGHCIHFNFNGLHI